MFVMTRVMDDFNPLNYRKMLEIKRFVNSIDDSFWQYITKNSSFKDVINFRDIKKDQFITELAIRVNSFKHHFEVPESLFLPKSNGILRKIKVFSISDSVLYYYCVKELQDELSRAIKSNPNVFGGFKFSPDLRMKDTDLEQFKPNPEYEKFAKNRYRKEWSEYQNIAQVISDKQFDYYIHIDIAHFYDDINLDILEKKLRSYIHEKDNIIDLLFHILKNSDREDLGYSLTTTGLPQEEVGEMSRLLANFYLYPFDRNLLKWLKNYFNCETNQSFVYTRFADDMWIAFYGDISDCDRIIQAASFFLQKIKLHINEKKLQIFDIQAFNEHWHFSTWANVFALRKDPKTTHLLLKVIKANKTGRWFSPYLYCHKILCGDKNNIEVFNDEEEALEYISFLIDNPKLLNTFNDIQKIFFEKLFLKYEKTLFLITDYLNSKNNIYPSVEYILLDLISTYKSLFIFDFLFGFYFKSTSKEYKWYSRIICVSFFILNIDYIESNSTKLTKLLNFIDNFKNIKSRERRYIIRFLIRLRDNKGEKILKNNFNSPSDLKFIDFIQQ